MARPPLTPAALPAARDLAAFARIAARWLPGEVPRPGGRDARRRQAGRGLSFLEHRDYRPGDDLRSLSWTQTARLGRPIVREYEAEHSGDWLLCVDGSASMGVRGAAKWRQAVTLAAALGYALLDAGHRVGLAVFATGVVASVPHGRGAHQYPRLARALAAAAPDLSGGDSQLGACVPFLAARGAAIAISDFLAPDGLRRDLARLAAAASPLHALALASVAECQLPEPGPLELEDVESGARRTIGGGAAAEREATRALASARASLARFARAAGIAYGEAEASDPWQQVLLRHLRTSGDS